MGKGRWIIGLLVLSLCAASPSQAGRKYQAVPYNPKYDEQLFHFGFLLGVNTMNFTMKTGDLGLPGDSLLGINHKMNPGFSVGVITNLRLARYLDLRFIPTFSLGQRDLIYTYQRPSDVAVVQEKKIIESIFVELPLDLKWKAKRLVNSRPYVLVGAKYTADLASLTKRKRDVQDEEYEMKLRRHDVGLNVGVGWEFYLPFNNKIAVELKMFFGMLDLLQREDNIYTDRIERLTSKMFQFNITFE